MTKGRCHDVRVARKLKFSPGTIVVIDRGYVDYAWFDRLTAQEVFFVTRMKDNAAYEVVEKRSVPERGFVIRDDVIRLIGQQAQNDCPCLLRRIEYVAEDGRILVFLTNHLTFGPTTIAAIYKERWQIELCFKELKQNLGTDGPGSMRRLKNLHPSRRSSSRAWRSAKLDSSRGAWSWNPA